MTYAIFLFFYLLGWFSAYHIGVQRERLSKDRGRAAFVRMWCQNSTDTISNN